MIRRANPLITALAAALVATAAVPRAVAAPRTVTAPPDAATDPGEAALDDAVRARFNEGLRFYVQKKYAQAYAAFLQAYSIEKLPSILLNLGRSALMIGRPLDAVRAFQQVLDEAKTATPAQRARADKGLAEARGKLGSLVIRAPDGAALDVDGESVGRAPLAGPVDVSPGQHEVKMTTADGTKEQTVRVAEGSEVTVRLVPARPAGAPASAPLRSVEDTPSSNEAPATKDTSPGIFSPPQSMAPVYVAGTIGLIGLTTAIIVGGMRANAGRNVSTATDALTRNGHDPAACGSASPDPTIGSACNTLTSAQRTLDQTSTAYVGSLVVGAGATLFALGWYLTKPWDTPPPATGLLIGPARWSAEGGPTGVRAGMSLSY